MSRTWLHSLFRTPHCPLGRRRFWPFLFALTASLPGCRRHIREDHTTPVPGFYVYFHEELRGRLRSQGQSDRLVDNPFDAVRRSGDHGAVILLTEGGSSVGVQAHILSGGKVVQIIPLNSDSVDFDMTLHPVSLPQEDGPVVDRCGRFYSKQRNAPAAICRVNHPNVILARATIIVHDVFSSEDKVFVVGATDAGSNERCLVFQVQPEKLELLREVVFPMRGSSEYGGLVRVLDLDEARGLAVVQPLEHSDNRSNDCFVVDLNTGDSRRIGSLGGDFGFFLNADVLSQSRHP